jgi:hypothetical protein
VAAVRQLAGAVRVAVRQQHRVARAIGTQRDGERRRHVGTIDEERDAAETFRLALREQRMRARVQAFEPRVAIRMDAHARAQRAFAPGAVHGQAARVLRVAVGRQRGTVEFDAEQFELLAFEPQRRARLVRVRHQSQFGVDHGVGGVQVEPEHGFAHPPRGRAVVGQADDGDGFGVIHHGGVRRGRARLPCGF